MPSAELVDRAGRSLDRIIAIGKASGYLQDFPEPVDFATAMTLPRGEVMIVATGGQGEPRAALARIAAYDTVQPQVWISRASPVVWRSTLATQRRRSSAAFQIGTTMATRGSAPAGSVAAAERACGIPRQQEFDVLRFGRLVRCRVHGQPLSIPAAFNDSANFLRA